MSFIGVTEERKISTLNRTFKIFITEQVGGFWVSTVLYTANGVAVTHDEVANSKADAYKQAVTFILNSIDKNAIIEPL